MDLRQAPHRQTSRQPPARRPLDSLLPDEAVGLGRPLTPPPAPAVRARGQVWIAASLPTASVHLARHLVSMGFAPLPSHPSVLLCRAPDRVAPVLEQLERQLAAEVACVELGVVSSELEPTLDDVLAELEPAERALARLRAQWLVPMLAQRRLVTYLQPVFDGAGGTYGEEALVRGLAPLGDLIEGGRVFAAARDLELEATLDRMLIEQSIEAFGADVQSSSRLFLNVSPASLERPESVVRAAMRATKRASISPGRVALELTEVDEAPRALVEHAVSVFRAAGFGVVFDDVGHAGDTVSLLGAARPDLAKVSGELVRRAAKSRAALDRLAQLVREATALGVRVAAKGIETTDELAQAQHVGIDLFQGFLLAHPRPSEL